MSVPKYIKEISRTQRLLKNLLFLGIWITLTIWIVHVSIELPENTLLIFIYPESILFFLCIIGFGYYYIRFWKEKIYKHENDIYETIAYRKKTSIKNIAKVKKIDEKIVVAIIERLIEQEKLFGIIQDGLFISEKPLAPICTLCNKEIEDLLFNMVLCPYCKRPFHKDHLIDYINEMEEKCPHCLKTLTIGDIIQ